MTDRRTTGRTLATRRTIVDVVRSAVLTSYGVTGFAARGPIARLLARLGWREPGVRVRLDRGLEIDLFVSVGSGLPIAEVARQIDATVRYAVSRAFEREVRRLTVHIGGLRYQPASVPPTREQPRAIVDGSAEAAGGEPLGTPASSIAASSVDPDGRNGHDPDAGSAGRPAAPRSAGTRRRSRRKADAG